MPSDTNMIEIDVRSMRRTLKMTQSEFASVMSVAKLTVQRWENGGMTAGLHRDVLWSITQVLYRAQSTMDYQERLADIRDQLKRGISRLVESKLEEDA